MDKTVNIQTTKTTLSKLVEEVESGGEVVLTRGRKQVAKLIPIERSNRKPKLDRRPGQMKGKIWIGPDFDAPLPEEIMKAFRGESD